MDTRLSSILRAGLIAYTVIAVLIIIPWTSVPTDDSKLLTLHVAAGMLGAVLAFGLATGRLTLPRLRVFGPPIALLATISTISALASNYPLNSLGSLTRIASLTILYLVAATAVRDVPHVRAWMAAACTAVALSCVYAVSQRYGLPALPWDPVDRSSALFDDAPGTFGNPNYAGHAIVLCTVFATYLTTRTPWALLFVVCYGAQLSIAFQRGAIVALAAAAATVGLAAAIKRYAGSPVRATVATLAVGLVVVGAGAVACGAYLHYFNGWSRVIDPSTILRVNAYASAAEMTLERPLLGFGPGNYVIENPAFWTRYEQQWFVQNGLMNQHVHSDILELGVDGGVLAAAAYILLIVLGAGYGLRMGFDRSAPRDTNRFGFMTAAFFVAFAVDGAFGFDFYVVVAASLLFIVAGCAEGILHSMRDASGAPARGRRPLGAGVLAISLLAGAVGLQTYAGKMASLDGRRALAARQYATADSHLSNAEWLQPWSWTIPYRRGAAAQLNGQLADARHHFQRTLARNPNYVPALTYLARLNLAEALARLKSSPGEAVTYAIEAQRLANHALALAPARPDDLDVLGRAQFLAAATGHDTRDDGTGAWRQAFDTLSAARAHGRKPDVEFLVMLAQSAAAAGDRDAAAEAFAEAAAALPAEDSSYAQYLAFAEKDGRVHEFAAVLASQLITAHERGNAGSANHWLARALERNATASAGTWNILRTAIKTHPEDPALWSSLADAAHDESQRREFASLVRNLVGESRQLPLTARVLGMAWSEDRGALAGATKALVDAQAALSQHASATTPVELENLLDRLELVVDSSPASTPGRAVAMINIGHVRLALGEAPRAAAWFETRYPLMKLSEQMLAAAKYAEALLAVDRAADAERIIWDLVVVDPSRAELRVTLARVLARAGKLREAYNEYALLLAIPDLDPPTRTMLEREQQALNFAPE